MAFLNLSINSFFIHFSVFVNYFYNFFSYTSSAKYYQQDKESLQKKAREKYQNLSKEKKKQQYGCEPYKNLSEDEQNKLIEYRKNIIEAEKTCYYNYKKVF